MGLTPQWFHLFLGPKNAQIQYEPRLSRVCLSKEERIYCSVYWNQWWLYNIYIWLHIYIYIYIYMYIYTYMYTYIYIYIEISYWYFTHWYSSTSDSCNPETWESPAAAIAPLFWSDTPSEKDLTIWKKPHHELGHWPFQDPIYWRYLPYMFGLWFRAKFQGMYIAPKYGQKYGTKRTSILGSWNSHDSWRRSEPAWNATVLKEAGFYKGQHPKTI